MVVDLPAFRVKIYADVANLSLLGAYKNDPVIKGFTTNPSLISKEGILNYEKYAKIVLANTRGLPVSFEVTADEPDEMIRQAKIISSWSENIYVKIPVTDTHGRFMSHVVRNLSEAGIKLNVTAVMTMQQVADIADFLDSETQSIISVFAGRIADTGRDPMPVMQQAAHYLEGSKIYLLWASCREVWNIFQAEDCGADIITVTPDILAKLSLVGKDLDEYSLDTVRQFYRDAQGLTL